MSYNGIAPQAPFVRPAMIISGPDYPECNQAYAIARTIRWLTGMQAFFAILSYIYYWPLMPLILALLYLAYEGARRYKANYLIAYIIYLLIMIAIDITLAVLNPNTAQITFCIFSVILELWIIKLTCKLFSSLKSLNNRHLDILRLGYVPGQTDIVFL